MSTNVQLLYLYSTHGNSFLLQVPGQLLQDQPGLAPKAQNDTQRTSKEQNNTELRSIIRGLNTSDRKSQRGCSKARLADQRK